jgi:hypothetical protein
LILLLGNSVNISIKITPIILTVPYIYIYTKPMSLHNCVLLEVLLNIFIHILFVMKLNKNMVVNIHHTVLLLVQEAVLTFRNMFELDVFVRSSPSTLRLYVCKLNTLSIRIVVNYNSNYNNYY